MRTWVDLQIWSIISSCGKLRHAVSQKSSNGDTTAIQPSSQSLSLMLRALVCACLLAIGIHASGPEGLHLKGSLLAPSSEQHGASFLLESDKDESSRVPELATLPPKPTDEHNTGSRTGPSASFGHPLARVPVPLELPTVVPPPLSSRRRNSSRIREPRDARASRHRGRRSSSDRPKPSRRNRDRFNSVALVTIAVHQESHRRGRHSSRRHNRQSCTIRVNEKNGDIIVDIYGDSPRGRGRDSDGPRCRSPRPCPDVTTLLIAEISPHRRSYSPRGRDGDFRLIIPQLIVTTAAHLIAEIAPQLIVMIIQLVVIAPLVVVDIPLWWYLPS